MSCKSDGRYRYVTFGVNFKDESGNDVDKSNFGTAVQPIQDKVEGALDLLQLY